MTRPTARTSRLQARDLTVGYGRHTVLDGLDVEIADRAVTTVIGPNGCGKSTLLRALAGLLPPTGGVVLLDGERIDRMRPRRLARLLGLLPQGPTAPSGLTVADLVARGRYPHQSWLRQWSPGDQEQVARALELTGITGLSARRIDELSGGQRQRVWISMTLAQETELVLLDEPTTFLDLAHSVSVLDLIDRLCAELGRTVVMVLHDLNLAVRYSDHLIAMHAGRVIAAGTPEEIISPAMLREVFDLDAVVITDPVTGRPLIVPGPPAGRDRPARPEDAG